MAASQVRRTCSIAVALVLSAAAVLVRQAVGQASPVQPVPGRVFALTEWDVNGTQ
jgi:hypothetical protein